MFVPTPAFVNTAVYPFVFNHTFAVSPASTPVNITLFDEIVAVVVPSYALLFAVNPVLMLTPNAVMFAVKPAGALSV